TAVVMMRPSNSGRATFMATSRGDSPAMFAAQTFSLLEQKMACNTGTSRTGSPLTPGHSPPRGEGRSFPPLAPPGRLAGGEGGGRRRAHTDRPAAPPPPPHPRGQQPAPRAAPRARPEARQHVQTVFLQGTHQRRDRGQVAGDPVCPVEDDARRRTPRRPAPLP